jgi:N-acetyl sugar amidotransferase
MNTSDYEITFNASGYCNHCVNAISVMDSFVSKGKKGIDNLERTVDGIKKRNKNRDFDALVGLSGGVDSTYATAMAHKAGLRLLAVHCDTGWNSEEATHNIHSLVNTLGIDLETIVVDWESMRDLQAAFFRASVPNCDIPQDHAIVAVNNLVAARFRLKDFVSGGNFASESILPGSWGHDARDLKHIKAISRLYGTHGLRGYPCMGMFKSYFWLPFVRGVRNYRILNDVDYHRDQAIDTLKVDYGWKDYGGKHHESRFTKFFQAHYLPVKFGFDKRRAHYSSLIVDGQISREEALNLLEKPLYDPQSLRSDEDYFLKKLGLKNSDWEKIMSDSPQKHDEYPNELLWHKYRTLLKEALEKRDIRVRRNW